MKSRELLGSVRELLQRPSAKPMRVVEIADALGVQGRNRREIQMVLGKLVASGDLVQTGDNRYSAGGGGGMVTGRLDIVRSGCGFLDTGDGREDIRISERNLGTALPGDLVQVRIPQQGRKGRGARPGEPRVVSIVKRGATRIVGTLKTTGGIKYVVPIDPAYSHHFKVRDTAGARIDDRVVVDLVKWDDRNDNPEGRIVEVIGPDSKASLDTISIIRHFGYSEEFPGAVLREADGAAATIEDTRGRLDLRDKFIFTIDPVTARDFDDALSLETDERGNRVLGVHIADVSHFVRVGSAMDKEARSRGNSVYFPDKVLPMLPHKLSSGACSLVPDEDRLAFSVFMTVDRTGKVLHSVFRRSVIRSRLRLNYEQAMEVLQTAAGHPYKRAAMTADTVRLVKDVGRVAQELRQRRFAAGAMDLDIPDYEIVLKPDGLVADVRQVPYDESHQLVEECMVAANEAVDTELSRRGFALIHRIHEPPIEDKLEDLTMKLVDMGLQPGDLRQRRNIVRVLLNAKDSPLRSAVQTAVLRSMCKAVYSAEAKGHFGLAKKFYAHFTSPIRRYPDLVVHRILGAVIESKGSPYRVQELSAISAGCSETEQKAAEAERDLLEIKKYRYLAQELAGGKPEPHDAVVVRVTDFGMFVELTRLHVSGLVHMSAMGKQSSRHRPVNGVLQGATKAFSAGTVLEVFISRVDFDNRRLDFRLA